MKCANIFCLALAISGLVAAQNPEPQQAIANRINAFREMGAAFKNIKDELKASEPNIVIVQDAAQRIKTLSEGMPSWFPPGSEPAARQSEGWLSSLLSMFSSKSNDSIALPDELESNSKLSIWERPEVFNVAYRQFHEEAIEMIGAANGGDWDKVSSQFRELGKTCKGCHQDFREEMD